MLLVLDPIIIYSFALSIQDIIKQVHFKRNVMFNDITLLFTVSLNKWMQAKVKILISLVVKFHIN